MLFKGQTLKNKTLFLRQVWRNTVILSADGAYRGLSIFYLETTHTRMLGAFKGFNFREWKTNHKRYGKPSKVTSMMKVRLLKSLDRCGAENKSWYARCSCGNQIMEQ